MSDHCWMLLDAFAQDLMNSAFQFYSHIFSGDTRVIVYDKDLIKQVMITECYKYDRPEFAKKLIPGVGNGLFASNGKEHAIQRKMINPAFHFTHLKTFVPAFVESTEELVQVV